MVEVEAKLELTAAMYRASVEEVLVSCWAGSIAKSP